MKWVTVGHFDVAELACHDGTPYPQQWVEDPTRGGPLFRTLNAIRELAGCPIIVISGFRSMRYNDFLIRTDDEKGLHGVASGSEHIEGRAADIRTVSKIIRPPELQALIFNAYAAGKLPDLGGLGLYPGWVHVDVRRKDPADHLAQWGQHIYKVKEGRAIA